MERGRERAGAGRHDERVQDDLPQHHAEGMQQRGMIAIGQLDQQRHDREQEVAVAAEDQRGGCRGFRAEHRKRQARSHVADIAVGPGQSRERRLAQRQRAHDAADRHGDDERARCCQRRCNQKWRVVELRKRRFRHDDEQQRRQRHVEQEKIHPGEAGFRQRFDLPTGVANENQAEIRDCKIDDIEHFYMIFGANRVSTAGRAGLIHQPSTSAGHNTGLFD
jgi:hypothetical protein